MRTLIFLFFVGCSLASAQKTLQLAEGQASPEADLTQIHWLMGHWKGEAFGGTAEEFWSPPAGGSMMFVFRLIHEDQISFYEIGHIKAQDGTLLMQLKHFDGALNGWEEKAETVDFKLVKLTSDAIYFEGLTIEKIAEDRVNFYVLVEEKGVREEVVFAYQRV
ncbi:MAG: hypothetical protein HRT65_00470 [Flavobacteriaceae bacterium]|nr:hypothetical protein [Flavobacteriaceae bacterium]